MNVGDTVVIRGEIVQSDPHSCGDYVYIQSKSGGCFWVKRDSINEVLPAPRTPKVGDSIYYTNCGREAVLWTIEFIGKDYWVVRNKEDPQPAILLESRFSQYTLVVK